MISSANAASANFASIMSCSGIRCLAAVLHHRLEETEHAALQDVGRGQVARVAELQDERQHVRANPVHRLRHAGS
jgi:hypothetical protein